MGKLKDLSGMRFGRLVVLDFFKLDNSRHSVWKCRCDCGNVVFVSSNRLQQRKTQSCGCLRHELIVLNNKKIMTKHGNAATRLYNIWAQMKQRCSNKRHKSFHNYGARGVSYCEEWESFEPFFQWAMSNGYEASLTLDRKDCNGNYCPENCRWITGKQQQNNKRNTTYATINGETRPISEWAEIYQISIETIRDRLKRGLQGVELVKPPKKVKGDKLC